MFLRFVRDLKFNKHLLHKKPDKNERFTGLLWKINFIPSRHSQRVSWHTFNILNIWLSISVTLNQKWQQKKYLWSNLARTSRKERWCHCSFIPLSNSLFQYKIWCSSMSLLWNKTSILHFRTHSLFLGVFQSLTQLLFLPACQKPFLRGRFCPSSCQALFP